MDNLALEKLINEANLQLIRAEEELQKPKDEMMSLASCQMSKLSMFNFLKAYLLKHKIEFKDAENLVQLYNKCKAYNSDFNLIPVQEMGCVSDTHCSMEEYCMDMKYVLACVNNSKAIRTLIYKV